MAILVRVDMVAELERRRHPTVLLRTGQHYSTQMSEAIPARNGWWWRATSIPPLPARSSPRSCRRSWGTGSRMLSEEGIFESFEAARRQGCGAPGSRCPDWWDGKAAERIADRPCAL